MLIDDALRAAREAGALVAARPIVPWGGALRTFLMCRPLHEAIEQARRSVDEQTIRRWAQLEADISHFVQGGYVTEDLMKHLEPPKYEHWELISRKPRPGIRVVGRFAKPNVFVGTHHVERRTLGRKWSLEWEHEKLVCEEHWRNACLPSPFRGERYEDYITDNANRRPRVPR